jgi:hypothetical protein
MLEISPKSLIYIFNVMFYVIVIQITKKRFDKFDIYKIHS